MALLFIWHDVGSVSENYHDEGGLGVIAPSLDAAREFLRAPYVREWTTIKGEKRAAEERHVPDACQAFTAPPDETLELVGEYEPRAFVWPNAGCC
jgi:hypothetical protein